MPQPVLTKYKQGDLGEPYPKQKASNQVSSWKEHVDEDVATKSHPSARKNQVQSSFWKKADEKDY